jgi:subtilisin family serine protease
MKRLIVVLAVLATACTSQKHSSNKPVKNYAPSEIISNQFVFGGSKENVEQYLKEEGIKASIETLSEEDHHYWVKYEGKKSVGQIVADLEGRVEFAEPNKVVEQAAVMRKAEWPTDKLFFKQWALNNIGQSAPYGLPGKRDADLDVMRVWDKVTKGSDKIVVALIDTGCDYTHPDLKDNIWVNEKESPANGGVPGKDDDGNGYIDDVYGYDFVSGDRTSFKGIPGDPDPMDDGGHGTHCAGSIGAKPNDGQGVAGLNWKVKIMCVRFLGDQGGSTVDAYRAVRYARENGAMIMSNSWGGTGDDSQLFRAELRKAQDKGILFVVAAGNDGTNNDIKPHWPSNHRNEEFRGKRFDNVLSVAASDNQDAPADFSNYGHESVDVYAPGVAIVSTYPQALTPPGRAPYATMSGTSMATPYVAGVAALMMAANPSLIGNAKEVIRLINETADVNETLLGKVASNGRINAYKAVTAQLAGPKAAPVWQTKAQKVNQRGFNTDLVDIRHEIKVEGAKAIKVHFDFVQIEEPYDSIYIYDKDYRLISTVEKNMVDDFWSPAIPGDVVYVRFVNSLLQQVKSMPMKMSSESSCVSRGASQIEKEGENYKCDVDSEDDSSNGGSKKYTSFNSEGFSIDQVSYITEPLQASVDTRKE